LAGSLDCLEEQEAEGLRRNVDFRSSPDRPSQALFTSPIFSSSKDMGICGDLMFTSYRIVFYGWR
jgi:hypothetical protein